MWKVNLFCDNHVIDLLTEKKDKKTPVFEVLFFLLSIIENYLQTSSSEDTFLGNFTLTNSIILMEDWIRWKRGSEIFLIDHCAVDIGNKNITGKY